MHTHPQLNIVIAGDESVGKSSLIESFVANSTDNNKSSPGARKYATKVTIKGSKFNMKMNELSDYEQPANINMSTVHGQVLIYDIANQASFDFVHKWIFQNRTIAPTILLANRCDLFPKDIDGKEEILSYGYCRNNGSEDVMKLCSKYYGQKISGEGYARQNRMKYFEVSAKTELNIDKAFKCIGEEAKRHHESMNIIPELFDRRPMIYKDLPIVDRSELIKPYPVPKGSKKLSHKKKRKASCVIL